MQSEFNKNPDGRIHKYQYLFLEKTPDKLQKLLYQPGASYTLRPRLIQLRE